MILEAVILNIKPGMRESFEVSFREASPLIRSMKGYISHELQLCMEAEDQYLLLVRWETLEDHTEGFRGSPEYQQWKALLHHYYDPFPIVYHYKDVDLSEA
ncbi:antibiotic biosynthesis monooxygenase family protein [Gorillibacterium sp. sgz5001074]|uniref:antibiotic biosynthesis monooxygenase family protein n=1 Tax=Gorillibacterium sp. sgz5001074 TaxID=3446695 RepID=UPI003F68163A